MKSYRYLVNSRMPRHSCCEVRVMQLHDILLLRTSAILPEAISAGRLTPTTDTSLFLTTYRGGSHLPADIYADNQFMKDYLEQLNTFDEGAFIVADGAYSGEENSQIAALDFQKLLDYINSLNNCAPKIETA